MLEPQNFDKSNVFNGQWSSCTVISDRQRSNGREFHRHDPETENVL